MLFDSTPRYIELHNLLGHYANDVDAIEAGPESSRRRAVGTEKTENPESEDAETTPDLLGEGPVARHFAFLFKCGHDGVRGEVRHKGATTTLVEHVAKRRTGPDEDGFHRRRQGWRTTARGVRAATECRHLKACGINEPLEQEVRSWRGTTPQRAQDVRHHASQEGSRDPIFLVLVRDHFSLISVERRHHPRARSDPAGACAGTRAG